MDVTGKTRLILNADDFGLTEEYNGVVLAAFKAGVISSATLMANMSYFEQACQLAHEHGLERCLGLHFNLTYGRPLSQAVRLERKLCNDDGEFDFCLPRHKLVLPGAIKAAIRSELEYQWQACLDQDIRPTHIDSHQHVHNMLPVAGIVAEFAGEQGVPVRIARNLGKNITLPKALFKWMVNRKIRHSTRTTDFACTPQDLLDGLRPGGVVEVICHPFRMENGDFGDEYLPETVSLHKTVAAAYPESVLHGFARL